MLAEMRIPRDGERFGRKSALRDPLLRVEEGQLRDPTPRRAPEGPIHLDRSPDAGQLDRRPHVTDVFAKARRPDGVRHVADLAPVLAHRPELLLLRQYALAVDLHADELALRALPADALQRLLADVVRLLRLDQALEAGHFERVVAPVEIGSPVEDPRLHAADVRGTGGPEFEGLAGLEDPVPQL